MTKDLNEIEDKLRGILRAEKGPLRMKKDDVDGLEATGTKVVPYGKSTVDGYYFASVIPKPKDIRFYFFPIYTHPAEFEWVPDSVRKMLKGKSCFYVKSLDSASEKAIKKMIRTGVTIYKKEKLI